MIETSKARSDIMRLVKGRDTGPEMIVRRIAHGLGYRYRLHRKDLPGKPDLVFSGKHKIIFVNGCFWHGHKCKRGAREPKTNASYWRQKIANNMGRDTKNKRKLKQLGWKVLVLWECELKDKKILENRIKTFLD